MCIPLWVVLSFPISTSNAVMVDETCVNDACKRAVRRFLFNLNLDPFPDGASKCNRVLR